LQLVPGQNPFPFDVTAGPGYVWHCHILDQEDNDMMRPMKMVAVTSSVASKAKGHDANAAEADAAITFETRKEHFSD